MSDSQNPERKQWHLDKSVSVAHILSTIVLAGSAYGYIANMEKRIALLEQAVQNQHEVDRRQDAERAKLFESLRVDVKEVSAKLDRLIERVR